MTVPWDFITQTQNLLLISLVVISGGALLSPLLGRRAVGAVHFGSFYEAMNCAQHIVKLKPIAVELVDRTILELAGSPEFVGKWAAGLGAAALGALVLCYVGGVVSAFASSTALLPVIIPIGLPLIAEGGLSAGLFVAALAVSSTIVDVSPFSTNGALMLANKPDTISEPVYYKQILGYSVIVVVVGPLLVWAGLVLPGW